MNVFIKNLIQKKHVSYLILFAFCFLTYYNVLDGEFLYDDTILIQNNPFIKSLANIPDFFILNPTNYSGIIQSNFYRPLQYVVNTLIYALFEDNTIPYHLFSILLHFINGVLICKLLQKFNLNAFHSLLLSTLFIIHPINLEAISYVSGVADPLSLIFMLTGINIFCSKTYNRIKYLQVIILFFLSLLSKESSVVFPFLITSIFLIYGSSKTYTFNVKLKIFTIFSSFLILLGYFILKFHIFSFTGRIGLTDVSNTSYENLNVRLLTFVGTIPEYLKLICYPKHLYIEKPFVVVDTIANVNFILGSLILVVLVFTFIVSLYKRKKLAMLGILWLFISFSPFCGIIPLNATFLEHWFYVPFVGLLLIFGGILYHVNLKFTRFFSLSFLILVTILVFRSHERNKQWSSARLFFENEYIYSPNSVRVLTNLGNVYNSNNQLNRATHLYKKALKINPEEVNVLFNYSLLCIKLQKYNMAKDLLIKSISLDKNRTHHYIQLYKVYRFLNDLNRAEKLEQLIQQIAMYGINNVDASDISFIYE